MELDNHSYGQCFPREEEPQRPSVLLFSFPPNVSDAKIAAYLADTIASAHLLPIAHPRRLRFLLSAIVIKTLATASLFCTLYL